MSNIWVPKQMFFTRGVGKHRNNLQSFEEALREAKIAEYNLVKVSSIYPPNCKIVDRRIGLKKLNPGQIVYCVMAEARTNEPNRLICSGIGLALPAKPNQHGYIAEHHGYGMTNKRTADFVEDMAASMLASTVGVAFDPDADYDERREIYKMSGEIVHTRSFVQTAEGDKNGQWTTVLAAAILVLESE